jgi:hypothetical protein
MTERQVQLIVLAAMMPIGSRRLSPPLLCALAALTGGLIAGTVTVRGLHERNYGPIEAPSLFARADAATFGPEDGRGSLGGYDSATAAPCDQCSERDLGYRWAALAAIRLPDQCPNDSWGFRRGCLDFVGGT